METIKGKKVYLLCNEVFWKNEESSNVLGVYADRNEAIVDLKAERDKFVADNKDTLDNYAYCINVKDTEAHYQCLDELMGESYELIICEETIK